MNIPIDQKCLNKKNPVEYRVPPPQGGRQNSTETKVLSNFTFMFISLTLQPYWTIVNVIRFQKEPKNLKKLSKFF